MPYDYNEIMSGQEMSSDGGARSGVRIWHVTGDAPLYPEQVEDDFLTNFDGGQVLYSATYRTEDDMLLVSVRARKMTNVMCELTARYSSEARTLGSEKLTRQYGSVRETRYFDVDGVAIGTNPRKQGVQQRSPRTVYVLSVVQSSVDYDEIDACYLARNDFAYTTPGGIVFPTGAILLADVKIRELVANSWFEVKYFFEYDDVRFHDVVWYAWDNQKNQYDYADEQVSQVVDDVSFDNLIPPQL